MVYTARTQPTMEPDIISEPWTSRTDSMQRSHTIFPEYNNKSSEGEDEGIASSSESTRINLMKASKRRTEANGWQVESLNENTTLRLPDEGVDISCQDNTPFTSAIPYDDNKKTTENSCESTIHTSGAQSRSFCADMSCQKTHLRAIPHEVVVSANRFTISHPSTTAPSQKHSGYTPETGYMQLGTGALCKRDSKYKVQHLAASCGPLEGSLEVEVSCQEKPGDVAFNCATCKSFSQAAQAAQASIAARLVNTTSCRGEDIASPLIEDRAEISSLDGNGYTALHFAALEGHSSIIYIIHKGEPHVVPQKLSEHTTLHSTAYRGALGVIEESMQAIARPLCLGGIHSIGVLPPTTGVDMGRFKCPECMEVEGSVELADGVRCQDLTALHVSVGLAAGVSCQEHTALHASEQRVVISHQKDKRGTASQIAAEIAVERDEVSIVSVLIDKVATEGILAKGHADNLASTYPDHGWYDEAETAETAAVQTIEAKRRILGHEHPDTLTAMRNLASMYTSQERYKHAEDMKLRVFETMENPLGKQVLEAGQSILGSENPDIHKIIANLATYTRERRLAGTLCQERRRLVAHRVVGRRRHLSILGPKVSCQEGKGSVPRAGISYRGEKYIRLFSSSSNDWATAPINRPGTTAQVGIYSYTSLQRRYSPTNAIIRGSNGDGRVGEGCRVGANSSGRYCGQRGSLVLDYPRPMPTQDELHEQMDDKGECNAKEDISFMKAVGLEGLAGAGSQSDGESHALGVKNNTIPRNSSSDSKSGGSSPSTDVTMMGWSVEDRCDDDLEDGNELQEGGDEMEKSSIKNTSCSSVKMGIDSGQGREGWARGESSSRKRSADKSFANQQGSSQADARPSYTPRKRPKRTNQGQIKISERPKRPFACPYFKQNPFRYSTCSEWRNTKISQVKEHCKTNHLKLLRCGRCKKFRATNHEEVTQHLENENCEKVGTFDQPEEDIDREKADELDKVKSWQEIYRILFPLHIPNQFWQDQMEVLMTPIEDNDLSLTLRTCATISSNKWLYHLGLAEFLRDRLCLEEGFVEGLLSEYDHDWNSKNYASSASLLNDGVNHDRGITFKYFFTENPAP